MLLIVTVRLRPSSELPTSTPIPGFADSLPGNTVNSSLEIRRFSVLMSVSTPTFVNTWKTTARQAVDVSRRISAVTTDTDFGFSGL